MPAKFLREPPVMAMSSSLKSVEASDRVKLMAAVSPTINDVSSLAIAMVGAEVSTVIRRGSEVAVSLSNVDVAVTE